MRTQRTYAPSPRLAPHPQLAAMDQQRWQKLVDWPLAIAAMAFLVAYSWQVIGELTGTAADVAEAVFWVTWGLFVIDYVVNLWLAAHRWRWLSTHLFDLAIVLLPMPRPLRLLRLVTLLAVLQRTAGAALRGRVILYVIGASLLLVWVAALPSSTRNGVRMGRSRRSEMACGGRS